MYAAWDIARRDSSHRSKWSGQKPAKCLGCLSLFWDMVIWCDCYESLQDQRKKQLERELRHSLVFFIFSKDDISIRFSQQNPASSILSFRIVGGKFEFAALWDDDCYVTPPTAVLIVGYWWVLGEGLNQSHCCFGSSRISFLQMFSVSSAPQSIKLRWLPFDSTWIIFMHMGIMGLITWEACPRLCKELHTLLRQAKGPWLTALIMF